MLRSEEGRRKELEQTVSRLERERQSTLSLNDQLSRDTASLRQQVVELETTRRQADDAALQSLRDQLAQANSLITNLRADLKAEKVWLPNLFFNFRLPIIYKHPYVFLS